MIHAECRLNQLLLTVFLKEEVDDITLLVALLVCAMMLVRKLLGGSIIRYLIDIDSRLFLDGIIHGQTCEWLSKVDLYAVVADLGASANLLCEVTEHGLRQLHHAFVVCVCLV